jgi:hypothetical protein
MNMLDPTAIANPDDYTREEIDGLFVRRFKQDVQEQMGRYVTVRLIDTGTPIHAAAALLGNSPEVILRDAALAFGSSEAEVDTQSARLKPVRLRARYQIQAFRA